MFKRMRFTPPTDHYDKRIESIDEEIVRLIHERKVRSDDDPGFPHKEQIASWAEKYHFYEDFLNSVFSHFLNEDVYKPSVEPEGFIKNIPVMQSFENGELFYTLTFIRQYQNASVVHMAIDRMKSDDEIPFHRREHISYELSVEGSEIEYDCRQEGGGGTDTHTSYSYVISPALPDAPANLELIFKEYRLPPKKATGYQFTVKY
ncbi:hypothetical protein [Falsibacillus pallidus]|uniref:Uncharacterized protein n=1 Tax=Falsibacillus pallidus TaxID=493781 RepID=A0A370G0H5_9BACI|nr:hypothetical protein [Falsibacillus pallidus]RDI37235.1 hypothetical protein DFR59_12225 [Falsibacillus pallidus]